MIQVVLCTVPQELAKSMARSLIKQKKCACINIVPKVDSVYFWQGQLVEEPESLLIIKTTQPCVSDLMLQIRKEHPYDTVEILSLPVDNGNQAYIDWVISSVAS